MILTLLISASQKMLSATLLLYVGFASAFTDLPANTENNNPTTAKTSTASTLKGIDVSRWQKHVDWTQVKEADITFAFVKATQADFRLDPYFARNWDETKRVGIKRGAYHFYIPGAPIEGQIEIFKNTVKLEAGDLPPVLDVEVTDAKVSGEQMRRDIKTWLEAITQHYGVKPIIYTNQNYYRRWLQGHFQDYHFWIARYSPVKPDIHHTDKWMFWQYTDRGAIPGINSNVDMNFFAGDWDTLHAMCLPDVSTLASSEEAILDELKKLKTIR